MQGPTLSLLPPPSRFNIYIHPTMVWICSFGGQNHVLWHILISSLTICPAPFLFCYCCTDIIGRFGKFGVRPSLLSCSLPPTYIMQNSAYSPVRRSGLSAKIYLALALCLVGSGADGTFAMLIIFHTHCLPCSFSILLLFWTDIIFLREGCPVSFVLGNCANFQRGL